MTTSPPMRDRILIEAEKRVRAVGFNAVSFRDLANDVGVKSSSVHYHFPQKEDLGEQLVLHYTIRFQDHLDQIDVAKIGPIKALETFVSLYADALVVGKSVCLCAILGSEANSLPSRVNEAVQAFFRMNTEWLADVLRKLPPSKFLMTPLEIVSALEGAMIVSSTMKNRQAFEATAQRIIRTAKDTKSSK